MGEIIAPGLPSWVDLSSPDVEGARDFYRGLFGWTETVAQEPEAEGYTTFFKDGKAVAAVGGLMSEDQPTVWTSYFATTDAAATAQKVEAAGGKVIAAPMEVMGYGTMAIFLDPAGAAFAVWQPGSMTGEDVSGIPGTRCWNELMTRDPEGSKTFYSAVLGWTARDVPFESMTYTLFNVGDTAVGGIMPMAGDDSPTELPPHWMVYFEVDDTDATAAKASQLGGSVSVPPTDTVAGRFAVLGDPHGAAFSVIKSNPDFAP